MSATNKFGIVIPCFEGDIHFVRALCCSIRYFVGDVPICLVVDGDFSTKDLETNYKVIVLKREDISSTKLREKSFGYGLTKMIVFWESPFEKFLLIDGDTLLWGNILKVVEDLNYDFDFIVDRPNCPPSSEYINKFYFDTNKLEKIDPQFKWQNRDYFNSGVIYGRRGILDLDEYLYHLDLHIDRTNNSTFINNSFLFKPGEMGFLNYIFYKLDDLNKIKLRQLKLQIMVNDYILEYKRPGFDRLPCDRDKNINKNVDPIVLHWAGQKPFFLFDKTYSWPMNLFREKYYQDNYGYPSLLAKSMLAVEDFNFLNIRFNRKIKKEFQLAFGVK
jgi:hypothetical protein